MYKLIQSQTTRARTCGSDPLLIYILRNLRPSKNRKSVDTLMEDNVFIFFFVQQLLNPQPKSAQAKLLKC